MSQGGTPILVVVEDVWPNKYK